MVRGLVVLCCPHLVNRTHDARSIFQSSSKCDENCLSVDKTERRTHILFVCKVGEILEVTEKVSEKIQFDCQSGHLHPSHKNTACAQVSF